VLGSDFVVENSTSKPDPQSLKDDQPIAEEKANRSQAIEEHPALKDVSPKDRQRVADAMAQHPALGACSAVAAS